MCWKKINEKDDESLEEGRVASVRWCGWAPPKANILLWRAVMGRLATKDQLQKRGITFDNGYCQGCGFALESVDHVLKQCIISNSVWWEIERWLNVNILIHCNGIKQVVATMEMLQDNVKKKKAIKMVVMATI